MTMNWWHYIFQTNPYKYLNCLKSSQNPIFAGDLPFDPHVFASYHPPTPTPLAPGRCSAPPLAPANHSARCFFRKAAGGRRCARGRERPGPGKKKQWLCEYIIPDAPVWYIYLHLGDF